jgi:hypothetical protein
VLAAILNCSPLETKSKLVTALAESGAQISAASVKESKIGLQRSIVSVPLYTRIVFPRESGGLHGARLCTGELVVCWG